MPHVYALIDSTGQVICEIAMSRGQVCIIEQGKDKPHVRVLAQTANVEVK